MKRMLCLICVLCLAAFAAVSAGATVAQGESSGPYRPDETVTVEGSETAPATEPATEFSAQPVTQAATQPSQAELMPIAEGAVDNQPDLMLYAALGASGLALLLSVIALAKSRRKNANAAGNYKKYF